MTFLFASRSSSVKIWFYLIWSTEKVQKWAIPFQIHSPLVEILESVLGLLGGVWIFKYSYLLVILDEVHHDSVQSEIPNEFEFIYLESPPPPERCFLNLP